ncbi:hypothetical protein M0813_20386 [Anaeramoeba flamelloides]|uniref:Uncharacterized protein n=1 Tax=Anaeramoeba flamelloides TaxID=1746091 RepID=A0ABQ8YLF5_9EUKA|nr:hypothetical protein M0813_20386 [Anaeramoeba flamelloides]
MNILPRKAQRIMVSGYSRKKLSHGKQGTLTNDDFEQKHHDAWSCFSKEEQGLLLKSLAMSRKRRLGLFRMKFSKYFEEKFSADDPNKIVSVYFDSTLLLSLMFAYRQGSSGTRNCWGTFYRKKGLKSSLLTTDSPDSIRMEIPNVSDDQGKSNSDEKQTMSSQLVSPEKTQQVNGARNKRSANEKKKNHQKNKKQIVIKNKNENKNKNKNKKPKTKRKTKTKTITIRTKTQNIKPKQQNNNNENVLPNKTQFSNDFLCQWLHGTGKDGKTKDNSCNIFNNTRKRSYEDNNIVSRSSCQKQQEQNNSLCSNCNKIKIVNNTHNFNVFNSSNLSKESTTNKTQKEKMNKSTLQAFRKSGDITLNRKINSKNDNHSPVNNFNSNDNNEIQILQLNGEQYSSSSQSTSKFVDFPTRNNYPLFPNLFFNCDSNIHNISSIQNNTTTTTNDDDDNNNNNCGNDNGDGDDDDFANDIDNNKNNLLFDYDCNFKNNHINSSNKSAHLTNDYGVDDVDQNDHDHVGNDNNMIIQDQEEILDQSLLFDKSINNNNLLGVTSSNKLDCNFDEDVDSFHSFSNILDLDLSENKKNKVNVDQFQFHTYSEIIERQHDVSNCNDYDAADEDDDLNKSPLNDLGLDFVSLQYDNIEKLFM